MNAKLATAVQLFIGLVILWAARVVGQVQTPSPTSTSPVASPGYVCVQRGPDSKVWQQAVLQTNADGDVSTNLQSYTELATGICYTNSTGQLVDSVEQVESVPGGAQAGQGQYSVQWGLNNGTPVAIQTPEGKTLTCQVYGLAYFDLSSGSNAAIARLQDSQGAISPPNQVIYSQSFSNINADILYTYTSAGLSQDIVFHQAPPAPDAFGLSDSNTVLQVYTQWFNTAEPVATAVTNGIAVDDQVLSFGAMQMNVGNSLFFDGNSNPLSVSPVQKQWVHLNGSNYLVESIPWTAISNQVGQLHPASNLKPGRAVRGLALLDSGSDNNTKKTKGTKEAAGKRPAMKMAKADLGRKRFVIDYYVALSSGSTVTLQGDTTYYVSSIVNVTSQLVVEGGAVVKYKSGGEINITGGGSNIVCLTGPYRMAVFTSMNDNSVGATISGSSGSPSQACTYINFSLQSTQSMTLSYLRFCYATTAVAASVETNGMGTNWIKFLDCQFYSCETGISCESDVNFTPIYVYNVLFSDVIYGIVAVGSNTDLIVSAENVTADNMSNFTSSVSSSNVTAINCIFTDVDNLPGASSRTACVINPAYVVYQPTGAGSYYLTNDSNISLYVRGQGTTSIDSGLLAELATLTTYPPGVISGYFTANTNLAPVVPRNNIGNPDIGYHYPPIDWALNVTVTNSVPITVTVSSGTVLAGYGDFAVWLYQNGVFDCNGTATSPVYLVKYSTVQEQSTANWTYSGTYRSLITPGNRDSSAANLNFTVWSLFGNDEQIVQEATYVPCVVSLENCQMYSGIIYLDGPTLVSSNSLYARVANSLTDSSTLPVEDTFFNNLFWKGSLTVDHAETTDNWTFRDNLFDQCNITNAMGGGNISVCKSNAYATNLLSSPQLLPGDSNPVHLTASPAYLTGTLGQFYYPLTQTNLIFYGSQLASAAGLYHYTVTTNNTIDGTNVVSIGFHYVATDNYGNPLDTYGDGLPDYIKDANGDGIYDTGDLVNWLNPFNIYDQGKSYSGYTPANVRLSYWRFNNASSLTNEHGDLPSANIATSVSTDWSGSSVGIRGPGTNLQYLTVESGGWTNFDSANGTVRFWFRPSWSSANAGGSGPGNHKNAAFLNMGYNYGNYSTSLWELYTSTNGDFIHFMTGSNDIMQYSSGGAETEQAGPFWNCSFSNGYWYQIALTYSPSNIAAYINGALIGTANFPPQATDQALYETGYGMVVWPTISVTTPFSVGNDLFSTNPINGEMDELETFNYPLSAEAIAYGFATFNGCTTNNEQDTDYVGRSDVLRTLVDGNPGLGYNVPQCRLGYWRFDTPLWIGEQGQFPTTANGVTMGTGWSGGALNVGSIANSEVTYPAMYSNGWASVNCRQGSVRFWFQPNWTSAPASSPFIYVGSASSSANYWTLETGTSGNTISFSCTSNGATPFNPIPNIAAPFNTNQWTQIVFTYGPTGCALYTNGMLAETNTAIFTNWPNSTALGLAMVIGNDAAGNSPVNGKFDELETFNYQLNTNQIWTNFLSVWNIDNNLDGIPDIIQDTLLATSTPFLGQPVVVAGTIKAEQFDRGGSGVAYMNVGSYGANSYRSTKMCVTNCNDLGGGYCLQTENGEWANYTINVLVPQTYAVETRVQGLAAGGWFQTVFAINGHSYVTNGPLQIPSTSWTNVTGTVNLAAGPNVMTVQFLTNGTSSSYVGRFNYLTIYPWWSPPTVGPTITNLALVAGTNFLTASNNANLIQSAINSLPSSGGTVAITNTGTFYVAQPKPNEGADAVYNSIGNITNSNIKICGAGTNTILVGYNRATTMFYLGVDLISGRHTQCINVTLQDMTLQAQPHMAVSNNSPTQVVYQSGMLLPTNSYYTGASVYLGGLSPSAYAYNILITNCQFVNADREIDIAGTTSNVLVRGCTFIQFGGTDGYSPGVWNTSIPYSQPDTLTSSFLLGVFAQSGNNYNIGVVGCSYNGNPHFMNQITANPNPTNYIANQAGAGNGLFFSQDGGNFFLLGNFITNNAEEAIQFGAGPATVAGNVFWSWAANNSCCALAPNMVVSSISPGVTGTGYSNYSVTFVGNSITGNTFGAYNDAQSVQGPYTLNFSGNSLSLFLPVSDPVTNALFGSEAYVWGCQDLHVCGNTMTSGGLGICYYGSCSNSIIVANNFSGVTRGSIEDWGWNAGPEIGVQAIGNILGRGYSYHLRANYWEGPYWFLYNNQYVDANSNTVPHFTDGASLYAHITP